MGFRENEDEFLEAPDINFENIFRVIDIAASQLTKTAITVTAIFIVALGYDLWYYLLAYCGLAEYKANSQLQKIGRYSIDYRMISGRMRTRTEINFDRSQQ